jgi:hypothetical protein
MMGAAVQISRGRDIWDVLALIVGLIAGGTAIVGFTLWILNLRRRPEVEFLWNISLTGARPGFRAWPQSDAPVIRVGETILVEASVHNIGDATGERALTNFVVPDCFSLHSYDKPNPDPVLTSGNGIAGLKPKEEVRFIARERSFYVDMWWMHLYSLTLDRAPNSTGVRILMELSEDRLNARGERLLRSLVSPSLPPASPYGTPWTNARVRRVLRRITVGNGAEVRCRAGTRQTVRDLRIESGPPRQ